MYQFCIIVSIFILLGIFLSKASNKIGIPSLLIFILLGMLVGSDGLNYIYLDNYEVTGYVSSISLVFIIFYGGFGTKWKTAKVIMGKATVLSSLGTILTSLLTGFFCMWLLKIDFLYGLLLGAVTGSTDAASVFSILRSLKLNLKNNLAPLLEIESGSNDPFAYMLTMTVIILLKGNDVSFLPGLIIRQLVFGIGVGVVIALGTVFLLKQIKNNVDGFYPVVMIFIVILGYALCSIIGGNGFLCVYIIGIIIGNSKILHKISLVNFFEAFSWLMQIALFFILGLLAFPLRLPSILFSGTLIAFFIILISRPIAVFSILSWYKVPIKQQLLVSWIGLRGAASILFAIIAMSSLEGSIPYDIFHMVLLVSLFSILVQGTTTTFIAKKLGLADESEENSVLKTFNDYYEGIDNNLFEVNVGKGNQLIGKMIVEINIPEDILIVMIKRNDQVIIPKGSTMICENDSLILSGNNIEFINYFNSVNNFEICDN